MISGTNLVTGRKSEYTYNGLLARVKKASDAIVSTYIPDYISGIIGGAFGFAGSALSQLAEGKGFNARKAWGAAANGAIVGAARGALTGSGVGIPAALGVNFAAGMAGSLAEQKLAGERMSPVRAAVDGAFNALGGRIYGTSPLRNAKDAFIRGALEGAVKGGAYNIADVLDNKLRNAHGPKRPTAQSIRNPRGVQPTRSRCPQQECEKARPFAGMNYPRKNGRGGSLAPRNDRFSLGRFVRDALVGAVMGGLASVAFYGAGKGVEALKQSIQQEMEWRRKLQYSPSHYLVNEVNHRGYVIKPVKVFRELNKSAVGKETIDWIVEKDINIDLIYKWAPTPWTRGRVNKNVTQIFIINTRTIKQTAKTIIHEVTHIVYGTARTEETNSIEEEFLCALRSQSHDNPEMSQDEIQQIYRMIERTYSYLKRDI